MKVNKVQAIAFLKALGFSKADSWDEEKLLDRLDKLPSKVDAGDVPDEFKSLYNDLSNSSSEEKIILVGDTGKPEKKSKKAKKVAAPKVDEPEDKEEPAKPSKKSKKAKKPVAEEKPAKPAPAPKKEVERDAFGSRLGTISAKVNAVLNDDWEDEASIAEKAKVTLDQARGRLYYAQQEGVIECRRLVQYRVVKKAKK